MTEEHKGPLSRTRSFLKTNLLAGILFLTPLAATFFFLRLLIQWVDMVLLLIPSPWRPENFLPFPVPGLGFIVLFALLLCTGFMVRNYLGRKLVQVWERVMGRIPLVNKLYYAVKQLIETVLGGSGKDFKRVVLIQFPRLGVYSLGFVTGVGAGEIQDKTHQKVLNIYVPTTPNPTSGYYLMVPEQETIPLEMNVEDAFKLLISGGIVNPEDASYRLGQRS